MHELRGDVGLQLKRATMSSRVLSRACEGSPLTPSLAGRLSAGRAPLLLACTLFLAAATTAAPAAKSPSDAWKTIDFATATCNYISPPMGLSFSLPPGFITLNPNHGPGNGCFWGTKEDLDRVITAEGPNFEKLVRGVFQARLSKDVAFDHATGLFSGEEGLETLLKSSGITGSRITHRKFGKHPGLIVTGKTREGSSLYLVYLAHGLDDNVLLINYRPATPPVPAGAAVWTRFLDSIQSVK